MEIQRPLDLFHYQQLRFPQSAALVSRREMSWQPYSTGACIGAINQVSAGLLSLGLERGDRAAMLAMRGSPRWYFLDLGLQQIGVVVVPLPTNAKRENLQTILHETKAKYCFAADVASCKLVESIRPQLPELRAVFTLENDGDGDLPGWSDLIREPTEIHLEMIQSLRAAIHEDDLATIAYTSGRDGIPKGVMLSHRNIVSNLRALLNVLPVNCDKKALCVQPPDYMPERLFVYAYIAAGVSVYFGNGESTFFEEVREVKPHFLVASPRLPARIHDRLAERAAHLPFLRRRIAQWAFTSGQRFREDRPLSLWTWLRNQVADLLVYRRWRALLGGSLEGGVITGGPLPAELGRLFSAAGIELREGYSLTEATALVTLNRFTPGNYRFGTAGLPLPGVEVRIDTPEQRRHGEILVRGPQVMLGYYRRENGPHPPTDPWLKTGDTGRFTKEGFLEIATPRPNRRGARLALRFSMEKIREKTVALDEKHSRTNDSG